MHFGGYTMHIIFLAQSTYMLDNHCISYYIHYLEIVTCVAICISNSSF